MKNMGTLRRVFHRNREFWSVNQRVAFLAACRLSGVAYPSAEAAESWRRQKGVAFAMWRGISKKQRKVEIGRELDRRVGQLSLYSRGRKP